MPAVSYYDEVFDAGGAPRAHAAALVAALDALAATALADAGRRRDAIFMQQGITFDAAGPTATARSRTARSRSTSSRGSSRPTSGTRSSAGSPSGSAR